MKWPDRFWVKVRKTADCWEWTAWRDRHGYGGVRVNGRLIGAHVVSYELCVSPVPDGLELDHLCRNRSCVRPSHLEPVTKLENGLRGQSRPAVNARKTHCEAGHPFSGDNLLVVSGSPGRTRRRCKVCDRVAGLRLRQSYKTERKANPSAEELAELLRAGISYVEIGRRFGVSDNAVRKWAKKFGL